MLGLLTRRKHLWLLLLYPLVGWGFSACEFLAPRVINVMEWQPLDGWIPFVRSMVWPYVTWYLTIVFALAWTGWDTELLRWIYTHDTPTNCNPSIHVIDTVGVWIALSRDKRLANHPWFQAGLTTLSLSIIASTVLVKQHSIVDVLGGLAWAGLWYLLIYSPWSPFFRFRSS